MLRKLNRFNCNRLHLMVCGSHASVLSVGTLKTSPRGATQASALLWPLWLWASSSAILWTWTDFLKPAVLSQIWPYSSWSHYPVLSNVWWSYLKTHKHWLKIQYTIWLDLGSPQWDILSVLFIVACGCYLFVAFYDGCWLLPMTVFCCFFFVFYCRFLFQTVYRLVTFVGFLLSIVLWSFGFQLHLLLIVTFDNVFFLSVCYFLWWMLIVLSDDCFFVFNF